MNDAELLQQYVDTGSQDAFSQLVSRHIDLVYAAACRQTRDSHLAEDVTQAVFIIFAKKAASVRGAVVLQAWLLSTTRYAASNAIKLEMRRRHHERKAAAMKTEDSLTDAPAIDEEDASLPRMLDEALSRLNEKDRGAVAMRYFQSKSLRDVGDAMGISEMAAQKRVARAVERMRAFFERRGVMLPDDSLSAALLRQSATLAPAALGPAIATGASKAAATSGAGLIAKAACRSMSFGTTKIAAAVVVATLMAAGAGVIIRGRGVQPPAQASKPAPASRAYPATPLWMPYQPNDAPGIAGVGFRNLQLTAPDDPNYQLDLDEKIMHTPGHYAGVVRSTVASLPNDAIYPRVSTPAIEMYQGKRVRVSVYLKTDSVERAAGINLIIYGPKGWVAAQDDMSDRAIVGTTDWQRYDTVADVPADARVILFGVVLKGGGTLWWDDFKLEIVGNDVAIADDRRWHIFGETPANYRAGLDPDEVREGHSTLRLSSTTAGPKEWVLYDHIDRSPGPLLGKRVKMSAMIKSEEAGGARLTMRAVGSGFKSLLQDEGYGIHVAKGTTDWMKYSIFLNVPPQTQAISSGVVLYGKGKVWIDDVKYEVVGDAPASRPE